MFTIWKQNFLFREFMKFHVHGMYNQYQVYLTKFKVYQSNGHNHVKIFRVDNPFVW